MIQPLKISIPKRLQNLQIISVLSLVACILLSLNLWCGTRDFPHIPFISNFYLLDWAEIALTISYCLLLLASLFLRNQRLLLLLSLIVAVVFVLADSNRLQPWFLTGNAFLFILIFYNGRVDDTNNYVPHFISIQIIVASIYFFTGLSRLNTNFQSEEYFNAIQSMQHVLSERHFLFALKLGKLIPLALIFIGAGLLISSLRFLAQIFQISFHVLLLFLLFPSANNSNYALWFSNFTFIFVSIYLFSGDTSQSFFSPLHLFKKFVFYFATIAFIVIPLVANNSLFPKYFTTNFKFEKNSTDLIPINSAEFKALPNYQKSFCKLTKQKYVLDYHAWCAHELNTSCFDEKVILKQVKQKLNLSFEEKTPSGQLAILNK